MVGSQENRVEGHLKGTQDAGGTMSVNVLSQLGFIYLQPVSQTSVKSNLSIVFGQHLFMELRAAFEYPFVCFIEVL